MRYIVSINLFFVCLFSYSQNFQISKIVVDINTKKPLESVIIFNENDYSTTNADGKFVFVSQNNEVNLSLLGYDKIKTSFEKLKNTKDTIFMQMKDNQLQEVVVNSASSYMKKVFDRMKDNYLQNYTVNFFLRSTLQKDTVTIVLQDIYAKKNRNTNKEQNTSVEILNMRKISLFVKKENMSYKFPGFNDFFTTAIPEIDKCSFTEVSFNDQDFKKIEFQTKEKNSWGQIWSGYFIINRKDYAIVEYNLIAISDPDDVPYKSILLRNGQYRTVKWNKLVQYSKDIASNKYYLSSSKFENSLEAKVDQKTIYYDYNMNYFVTNSPTNEKVRSNFSIEEDVFKAKFSYSKDFWDHQNQLPLTKELEGFLKSVLEKKEKKKEYEVIGNF